MTKSMANRLKVILLALALAFTALGVGMFASTARAADTPIDPLVWYKFDDPSDPGKDAMGNYNLTKTNLSTGTVTVADGQATFDGKVSLAGASEAEDVSEELTSFTLLFKMIPDANQGARGPIVGFSWNNWGATKYAWFTLAQTSQADEEAGLKDGLNPLRFSTHGVGDGSDGRDYGYELKKDIKSGTEYSLALSVQLGGKIVGWVECDPRLRGVRDRHLQFRRQEITLVFLILHIGVERVHHALHQPHVLLRLPVLDALQVDVVEVVLLVQQVDHAEHLVFGIDNGLADRHARIHDALLVGNVDLPVYEGPQEVPFPELQDMNGAVDLIYGRLV